MFVELGKGSLGHLKKTLLAQQQIWVIGPLLPIKDGPVGTTNGGEPSSVPASGVITSLDSCFVDKYVVYVVLVAK